LNKGFARNAQKFHRRNTEQTCSQGFAQYSLAISTPSQKESFAGEEQGFSS